jgi:flagellar basal body rod protein FlgG
LALDGPGFLAIDTPRGVRFSRGGALTTTSDGMLTTQSGLPVLGKRGRIFLDRRQGDPTVAENGDLFVGGTLVDRLQLVEFDRRALIRRDPEALFEATPGAMPRDAVSTEVRQHQLEDSNASGIRGMVSLIQVSRSFELLTRTIETYRAIDQRTAREVGSG